MANDMEPAHGSWFVSLAALHHLAPRALYYRKFDLNHSAGLDCLNWKWTVMLKRNLHGFLLLALAFAFVLSLACDDKPRETLERWDLPPKDPTQQLAEGGEGALAQKALVKKVVQEGREMMSIGKVREARDHFLKGLRSVPDSPELNKEAAKA
jgi:hypothetical protein